MLHAAAATLLSPITKSGRCVFDEQQRLDFVERLLLRFDHAYIREAERDCIQHGVHEVAAADVEQPQHWREAQADQERRHPVDARAERGTRALDLVWQHLGQVDPRYGADAEAEEEHESEQCNE